MPAPLGAGDLAVAKYIIDHLHSNHDLTTALWDINHDVDLARNLHGKRIIIPPINSGLTRDYVDVIATQIKEASPDAVIAINYPICVLAGVRARVPVIQLTHQFDFFGLMDNRASLELDLLDVDKSETLDDYLKKQRENIQQGDLSLLENIEYSSFRFGQRKLLESSMIYLTYILSNHLLVHSFFTPNFSETILLNRSRLTLLSEGVNFVDPLVPTHVLELSDKKDESREFVNRNYLLDLINHPLVLVTFGGFNHGNSQAYETFIGGIKHVCGTGIIGDASLVFVGRFIDEKRQELENQFGETQAYQQGRIKFLGNVTYQDHLRLISASDLVLSHCGYSTISEVIGMNRPLALFYGLTPTYERQVNLQQVNDAGLCLRGDNSKYWMQMTPYHSHDEKYVVSSEEVFRFLEKLFKELNQEQRPHFDQVVQRQKASLTRSGISVIDAIMRYV
ncbi:MAG: hypothetical protein WC254_03505 [Candidatus Woesearchaeota archaeon]|jgi:hypothetical protein